MNAVSNEKRPTSMAFYIRPTGTQISRGFQGAQSDHVRVQSSSCCFPRALVSFIRPRELKRFNPRHVTRSPPIRKRIWVGRRNKGVHYSTNCNTIQIWSWCSRYLSSVGNRYPGGILSFVRGKKKWSEKMPTERFKNVTSFVINLLNNKTIILLNLAEYRLILADSAYGLVG